MNHRSALNAWAAAAAWAWVAGRLTWRLARSRLGRMRTLVPPIGLLLGSAFTCLTASRLGLSDAAAVLMMPGDLGPGGRGTDDMMLFWTLSYALLPLQVLGLHEVAMRGSLIDQLRPLAVRASQQGPGWRSLRGAVAAIAVLALLGIGKILFGSTAQGPVVHAPGALAAFLVVNWLLLHLLMAIVTLTTMFFAACGTHATGNRDATDRHRRHPADSRHAPG
ncbi:hypothetical protein [Rhizobacter sp. OV335]|jgi:hypothetical protein|uniref:hypothetical protein n=1 Tax=Rhizobacter sp. OV335 TaxID=1500264 RepID=UPI00091415B7|nr:hypothetical protein [Rhizobacter sp. OV335]SHN35809.1 hypothetical protein SAMN02787076_05524 [Rhizobacter sp. OV335]